MTTSTLLREARCAARLSQRALARRAGTSQPAVARYESGLVEPRADTLERLLAACGKTITSAGAKGYETRVPARGPVGRLVRRHHDEITAAADRIGALAVAVFGSTARGEDRDDSDLDLLVDLPPELNVLVIYDLKDELETLLGVEVDVLTERVARPEVLAQARIEAVVL
jgi:predicted nucleotidyltransferase